MVKRLSHMMLRHRRFKLTLLVHFKFKTLLAVVLSSRAVHVVHNLGPGLLLPKHPIPRYHAVSSGG